MDRDQRHHSAPDVTIIVLTYNEERHIERCLTSAFKVARQVFVVDSFSTDQTVTIAESVGAQTHRRAFVNHAEQLAWALANLPIDTAWVMRLDADEVIEADLVNSIRDRVVVAAADTSAFLVQRHVRFAGGLIRHGNFPQWNLRIWRKGMAEIEQRWMDEHITIARGGVQRLAGRLTDDNLNGITWWTEKHNNYATREAVVLLNVKYGFLPGASGQPAGAAGPKRWIKERIYARLPIGTRAILYFLYRMFIQLGVLDGRAGLIFHFLQGCWYRFLVDVKVAEVELRMREDGVDCVEAIRQQLGVDPVQGTRGHAQSH